MPLEIPQLPGSKQFDFESILRVVTSPLHLLALVVLGALLCLPIFFYKSGGMVKPSEGTSVLVERDTNLTTNAAYVAYGLVAAVLLVVLIVGIAVLRANGVEGLIGKHSSSQAANLRDSTSDSKIVQARVDAVGDSIAFFDVHTKEIHDYWYRELRPVLHQAVMYSTPTYYLDTKLDVVDWNIAFDLIFNSMTDKIRGKHVTWLIARLTNHSQVFDHAKAFTDNYQKSGVFPFVDVEPLEYQSSRYGIIRFTKIATQLHDADGKFKGWSIALMVDEIGDRALLNEDLQERIGAEKMWSVYSASYDRVLSRFSPYQALIDDVIEVLRPGKNLYVADLGSGTGNVTAALLAAGHRVLAVENNGGMLDRFAQKSFPATSVSVVKTSVGQLSCLNERLFDAVVMMNVLYAVDDPLACLRGVYRILKPGGVLGLSTTHRDTDLGPLLNEIEAELRSQPNFNDLADDWNNVRKINRMLEKTIVRRHTRDDYLQWLELAGFEVTEMVPSTYCDAVMLVHARRRKEAQIPRTDKTISSIGALA